MNTRVLCVDDDGTMLSLFRQLHGHPVGGDDRLHVETEQDAGQALAAVTARGPYAVILSDMEMPGMNGVEFLGRARQAAPETVRVMLTGHADLRVAMDAVNEGHVFRFLTKPVPIRDLVGALAAGVRQYRLVTAEKELLEKTLTGSIRVLTDALAQANPTAFGRAGRVRDFVKQMAACLRLENVWELELAAMLSQTGCLGVPEAILRRVCRGADVPPEDWEVFAAHTRAGRDLVAQIPRLEAVAAAIAYQEKRFDGAGYPPDATKGADIPLGARLLKVALDFDSLQAKGLSRVHALDYMSQRVGWYDPRVMEALRGVLEEACTLVLKEVGVQELLDQLDAVEKTPHELDRVKLRQMLGRMVLADNVWTTKAVLVLSSGHELTLPLLERLRRLSRKEALQEPIRVWVPQETAAPGP